MYILFALKYLTRLRIKEAEGGHFFIVKIFDACVPPENEILFISEEHNTSITINCGCILEFCIQSL